MKHTCLLPKLMSNTVKFSLPSGVPLFNALFLRNLSECHHKSCIPETRFFGLHYCRRQYGFNFNHFDVIGRQIYRIHKITQNNSHYTVQGNSRSPVSVPIESPYGVCDLQYILSRITRYRVLLVKFWVSTGVASI